MEGSYDLVALFGAAGAGKDTILDETVKNFPFHKLISYTTRSPRENEENGVHYYFCSDEQFSRLTLLESTKFNNWNYGTAKSSLKQDQVNIGVFNIEGINNLIKQEDINVYPVYVYCDDKTRLLRQLSREQNPDCAEICRRFLTDKRDFEKIEFDYSYLDNTKPVESTVENLGQIFYDLGIIG